eukprot:Nitzschia sp. Nitz4//scaffold41_size133979//68809//69976//NITZ4_003351-RA/size133979-processed-gene-0.254-mRNA-1//-1//CDS//3329551482//2502//frame0
MDFSRGPLIGASFPHKSPVSSLSYHGDGVHLFAATEADSKLYLINAQTGKCDVPPFRCEREGISKVSRTHHDECVLFTGTKGQHAIHYWSLHDNKILRKFRGHSDKVLDLSMSPADDMFLTASSDRTVRLWNVQQAGCVAQMELPPTSEGDPRVVFDSTGMVFAVTVGMAGKQGNHIHLYDARNFTGGAFSEMKVLSKDMEQAMSTQGIIPPSEPFDLDSVHFNGSGNQMLVNSSNGLSVLLDGYEGTVQNILQSKTGKGIVSCFTPDDQSVLMGTDTGTVEVYNVQTGSLVKTCEGHTGPVNAIACNPKYQQIASGCSSTCLWIW